MRLNELYQRLLNDQLDYYDRMYTLSSGEEQGWPKPLADSRRDFVKHRFEILKKPFVEGIPRYHKEEGWTWKELSKFADGKDKIELDELAELLESYSEWTPYPHQIESVQAWQQGKHIVVATGTGSGKTECFLYPMLGQLLREAKRAKQQRKPMQRGIKALVLYPMNALVADQTVRIRNLFGTLEMAAKLQRKGSGRPCQFGMYTGRSPAHGWYSEPGAKKGTWKFKTNGPRNKVKSIVSAYTHIENHHPDLWERLVRDRRVPAKGGTWVYDEEGRWGADLVSKTTPIPDGVSMEDARFSPVDNWTLEQFEQGIERNSKNGFKKQSLPHVGTEGDRELYARYEMHQGGLIQYALNSSTPTDTQREAFQKATEHLGVPDILVTNYSMLEYMLLRPLEHVFWEDTKSWLYGDVGEGEPPRKLMLVLDEAHLYQGAMGTEVSMLINRLRSVLSEGDKNPDIQVIITSASLGQDEGMKKEFVADLTGIDPNDVVVPEPARTDLLRGRKWDDLELCSETVLSYLASCDASTMFMENDEYLFLQSLNTLPHISDLLDRHYQNQGHLYERMELRHRILNNSDLFIRLYTALQHPKHLPKDMHTYLPHGEKVAPWDLQNLSIVVFGRNSENLMSRLLDVVAGSRLNKTDEKPGLPLMPIRGHIFSRGMPRLSVCPRCSSFHKLETLRCDQISDSGEQCNARPFELVYGRSTGVAFLNLWIERLDKLDGRDSLIVSTQPQFVWSSSTAGSNRTRRIALASWRCTDKDAYTHILDMDKGSITPKHFFNSSNYNSSRHAYLKVAGFSDNGIFDAKTLWKNSFDEKDTEFFDRICPATKRNHSYRRARQVSNLETRGNEAFSALIDGLMQQQDDVLESRHLPNGGKKCLVFSDSRQQAANVAVELGQLSNHDETRRLLMAMLHERWFKELPVEHRSITGMFPWFALYCTSKGMNPFAGGDYAHDRSLFAASGVNTIASILAARASCFLDDTIAFNEFKAEVEQRINKIKPSHCETFSFGSLELSSRIRHVKSTINNLLPNQFDTSELDIKISAELKKQLVYVENVASKEDLNIIITSLEKTSRESNWPSFQEKINESIQEIKGAFDEEISNELFVGVFERIVSLINQDWLIASTELAPLAKDVIELSQENQVRDFISDWNSLTSFQDHLPFHVKEQGRWTDGWSQFIVRILFDGEYGVEEIGIGYVQINDYYWNKLDEGLREKFPEARYLIPRMFSKSFNTSVVKGIGSKLEYAVYSNQRMPAFNPQVIGQALPWKKKLPGADDIIECENFIKNLYKRQDGVPGMFLTKLIRCLNDIHILQAAYAHSGLNAEALEIIPTIQNEVRICSRCYRPRTTPSSDQTKCGACESESFMDSSTSEFSKRYKALRIDPWRRSISQIVDGTDDIFLLRVEEHTAQIGDKLDESDLYSPAELHELQFQDIPVPDSTSVINSRSSLPPIDVLSCTTTMEVGIDIGSLTCVALRSMPPHSANYQQRIGRAGRGASEVSVALTWADNSAYAQQLYEQPERLLHHPDSPPILYMENRRIQQRHFQASLLQLFMKHRPYIRDLLIFDGMADENKVVSPNMVESLGLVNDFFEKRDNPFGYESFKNWVHSEVDESFIEKHFSKNDLETELFQNWKREFISRLADYKEA
jgi:ATP-dependent helicase YprA (DUF1998 family)